MPKIQYEDKQKAIDFNAPALNEMFTFQDANEIKYSVNELYDELEEVNLDELREEVATNTATVLEAKEHIDAALNSDVTVDTYAQAVALFTGMVKRTIFVNQSSAYNDPGEYFVWFPVVQKAAHMGLDFNYI